MADALADAFASWQATDSAVPSADSADPEGASGSAPLPLGMRSPDPDTTLAVELDTWRDKLAPTGDLFGGAPTQGDTENPLVERTRDYLSATQLLMVLRCAEQFRRRYLLGEKERPGAALIQGSADHRAHEHNFRQKIESERDLPVGDVTDAFDQAWRDKIDEAGGESEVEWGRDDKPSDVKDKAAKLVALYHREASPLIQPVGVEEEFFLTLPGVTLPIRGFVDIRMENGLIERKTTGKRQTLASKPDWRLQGAIYSANFGLPVFWHQATKTKVPAVYVDGVHLDTLNAPQLDRLAKRIRLAESMIEHYEATLGRDVPWPGAETHPWACGFCGWRPSCFWWAS